MQEIIGQALTYVWGIWRHKWLALAVAWVVALGGWAYVYKMPESYVAKAKVYVDTNTVLRPLLRGLAITPDINQRVRMMSGTLFSRPNLEKLARMTDLDLTVTDEEDQEELISELRDTISLVGQRGNSSLYNIQVKHPERDTARRIAQSLITVFIESSLNEKRDDSTGAQDFLDEQIADYERRLIESEDRLARFKQQNVDVLPSKAGADYYTRLETTRGRLQEARLALSEATERRDALREQMSGGGSVDGLVAAGVVTPTDARIQQMRLRLDGLLARYTDKHPEVRQIRGLIEELENQRQGELQAISEGGPTPAGSGQGASDMQTLLSSAEATVAELNVRVAEYERREKELAAKVNEIPEVEAQLKQLDRDYQVVVNQHTELMERRESARLSQGVEDNASDVSFRVVDPPFVPSRPSEPNKLILNVLVLFAALGAGAGLALIISLLRPIVVDARMLAEVTGLPLLGVVTHNKDNAEVVRDRLRFGVFAMAASLLLVAFGGALFAPEIIERVAAL
ncbi:XrtA system polysaccharide chain length determinant [Congregibacter litoralis]|uniref:Polysaccharide chain length determinant protein, PEP-CTERM locus subfamily n=1 Tax=Congregibacter litoralis KT71 TaxID=314285 RepID=A4A534_9GAMM|nr:XrtA system polysaccharide chain length determinant [Congregibacter litoralis]EAQ98905.1 polysaccharide chain length determinant protein, PEP-CTERM locus subfamily [Congregibacter litoralis KT71]